MLRIRFRKVRRRKNVSNFQGNLHCIRRHEVFVVKKPKLEIEALQCWKFVDTSLISRLEFSIADSESILDLARMDDRASLCDAVFSSSAHCSQSAVIGFDSIIRESGLVSWKGLMKIPTGESRVVEILLLKIILKKFSDLWLVLARVWRNYYSIEKKLLQFLDLGLNFQ